MGLEGSFSDFRVSEIVQLIGQQFKTGVLHAEAGRRVVEVFFLDGLIVHVLANYRAKRDLLGEILLKAKKISQEDLERVLKKQDETLQYAGEIMVELKLLSEDEIVRVISTQVYETIYDLLSWKEGHFRFEPRAVESYKRISVALSPEHVLLNVLRMMDEWPSIEERLSSLYVVFKRVKPLPSDLKEMSPEKQLVFGLTDGKLTLQQIIDRSLLGRFNACEAMVELWDQGYVERVGIRKPSFTQMMGARVGLRSLAIVPRLFSYGIMLVVAVILILFLKPLVLSEGKTGKESLPFSQTFRCQVTSDRIRNALTVYYLENGEYPESLENLILVGIVPREDLALCEELPRYSRGNKGGYELTPLSP
jgi:hypothetical protein